MTVITIKELADEEGISLLLYQARYFAPYSRRPKKFVELFDNPFPKEVEVEFHHLNDILTIPLPEVTHRIVNGKKDSHMQSCAYWIEKIYGINIFNLFDII